MAERTDVQLTDTEKAVVFRFAHNGQADLVAHDLGVSEEGVQRSIDEVLRKLQLGSFLCALVETGEQNEVKELAEV